MFSKFYQLHILIFVLLAAWVALFFVHRLDLTTADLGRHLKNGELLLKNLSAGGLAGFWSSPVLRQNFYSYTEPAFPFVNHHWLSGVIFYLIWRGAGWAGLQALYIFLALVTFGLFYKAAKAEGGLWAAALSALLVIPLIGERTEIRPEGLSYFFAALFFYSLWAYRRDGQKWRLWPLLPLQLIWANSHIYFVLGPALAGLFWLAALFKSKFNFRADAPLGLIFIGAGLISLFNPFTWRGLVEPFLIFKDYGYRLLENQPIWFLNQLTFLPRASFIFFQVILGLAVLTFIWSLVLSRKNFNFVYFCFLMVFGAAAVLALRNFAWFGFFILPVLSYQFKIIGEQSVELGKLKEVLVPWRFWVGCGVGAVMLLVFFVNFGRFKNLKFNFGLGPYPGNSAAAEFFKSNGLVGPIFNDYDLGGYLIFYLFPAEPPFVDNRPEAYSYDFLQKVYIPMQDDEAVWRSQDKKYNFNVIFFSHRDYTTWAQKFLINRYRDAAWAPVFADNFNIIFLKRNAANAELIKKFELPKDYFRVTVAGS